MPHQLPTLLAMLVYTQHALIMTLPQQTAETPCLQCVVNE